MWLDVECKEMKINEEKLNNILRKPLAAIFGIAVVGVSVGILFASTKSQVDFQPQFDINSNNSLSAMVNTESFDSSRSGDEGLSADEQSEEAKSLDAGEEQIIKNSQNDNSLTLGIENGDGSTGAGGIGITNNSSGNQSGVNISGNGGTGGSDESDYGGAAGSNSGFNSGISFVHMGDGTNVAYGDETEVEVVTSDIYFGSMLIATNVEFNLNMDKTMYLCGGENPTSKYVTDFLNLDIMLATPRGNVSVKGKYIYKNDTAYGGDYTIDWDVDSADNGIQDSAVTAVGKHKAQVIFTNIAKGTVHYGPVFEYETIEYRVKLMDFNENFQGLNDDELIQTVQAAGDRLCNLASCKELLNKRIVERTASGKGYIHTYKTVNGKYEGYFLGWSRDKNSTMGVDSYRLPSANEETIKTNQADGTHYLEEVLYPIWSNNVIESSYFDISVNSLGELVLDGFKGDTALVESIDVPEGIAVLDLRSLSVKDFPKLKLINIPSTVTEIIYPEDMSAFSALQAFGVSDSNQNFLDVNGVLYNKSGKKILKVPAGLKSISAWSIKLEEIDQDAFVGTTFDKLSIPATVRKVSDRGFANCKINELILNSDIDFGLDAFSNNTANTLSVSTIRVADSENDEEYVKSLKKFVAYLEDEGYGDYQAIALKTLNTFSGLGTTYSFKDGWILCDDGKTLVRGTPQLGTDETVPSGVTRIRTKALMDNADITKLTLPESVTQLETSCFASVGLKEVEFTSSRPPSLDRSTGDFLINNAAKLLVPADSYAQYYANWNRSAPKCLFESVMMPYGDSVTTDEYGVKYWETSAGVYTLIDGSKASGNYVIKDGTTAIKYGAFEKNTLIESIVLSSQLQKINPYSFCECSSLSSVTVTGTSLTAIDEYAFAYCNLSKFIWSSVDSTKALYSIGEYAFLNTKLAGMPSNEVPTISDENISEYNSCVIFEGHIEGEDADLFANLSSIGNYAFASCRSMNYVSIPTGLNAAGYDGWNGLIKSKLKDSWFSSSGMRGITAIGKTLEALKSDAEVTTDGSGGVI